MITTAQPAASLEALTQHQRWMFARAYEYTRNPADAQDAVQEAYLRYIERAPAEVENPKAYLGKILENVLHTSKRGSGKFEIPCDVIAESPSLALSPQQEYELLERRAQTEQALSDLKPTQRRVLLLLSEGLTPREIAPILGMTPHAVSAREVRAKINLRIALMKRGFVPVAMPFYRLRAKFEVWAETLRYQPIEALALMSATILMPMILAEFPPTTPTPPADSSQAHLSVSGDGPLPMEDDSLPAPGSLSVRLSAGRAMPIGAKRETVTRVEGPAQTEAEIEHDERSGTSEASLQDQILNFVGNPGSAPMPGCEGNLPC